MGKVKQFPDGGRKLSNAKVENPCTCGSPFRDLDDRCLRCKKQIDPQRAQKLEFHRKVSEIPSCKCSDKSKESWGARTTSIEGLELCNFCDSRFGGEIQDPEDISAKEEIARKEAASKALKLKIEAEIKRIISEAQGGKIIYLYRSHYVSVDSFNNFGGQISATAPFNDVEIKFAGTQGWRVVEAIPRTSGETLQNYEGFGKAWAGGIGGTVVGAYVLMEFAVTSTNAVTSEDLIRETVSQYLTT